MEASQLLAKVGDSLSAVRAFGEPIDRDGITLVPVAYVVGGGGGGTTPPPAPDAPSPPAGTKGPSPGDGAGLGVITWPVGAYVIKDGQARFVPTVDVGQLVLVGSFVLSRMLKALRRRRR